MSKRLGVFTVIVAAAVAIVAGSLAVQGYVMGTMVLVVASTAIFFFASLWFVERVPNNELHKQRSRVRFASMGPVMATAEDLADDLEDVRRFRITRTMIMSLVTLLLIGWFSNQLIVHHKFGATWFGGIPVFVFAAIAVGLITFKSCGTEWFQDRQFRTPFWVYVMVAAALIGTTSLGLYMTEPVEEGGSPQAVIDASHREYDYTQTRAHTYIYTHTGVYNSGSSSSSFHAPACSGKGCGYAYLVILLVVLILVLLAGSAFIAHFWVLAGLILLSIMMVITWHEVRVRPFRE